MRTGGVLLQAFVASVVSLALLAASRPALADLSHPGCVVRPYGLAETAGRSGGPSRPAAGPPALAPTVSTGNVHLLVILAEFADVPARIAPSRFDDLLFGPAPSVGDYYDEVSDGKLSLTGDLHGWVTLPQTEETYSGGNQGIGLYPQNGQRMAEDAIDAAVAGGLDLADYDADGDGLVDACLVIHSGQGYEWAGLTGSNPNSSDPNPNAINSHKWVTRESSFGGQTTRVVDYFTCPELQLLASGISNAWADSIATIGVYCHEFGHMLGLPDYYTEQLTNRVGPWDLMDFGTWTWQGPNDPDYGAPGASPSHFSAWSKMFLGWVTPTVVSPPPGESSDQTVTLASSTTHGPPLQLRANPNGVDWTTGAPGTGEYFLVEVRTRQDYDAGLPVRGTLIYHVDESRAGNRLDGNPDGGALLRLRAEDGSSNVLTSPMDTDRWPGPQPGGQSTFDASSQPSSDLIDGTSSGVSLANIGSVSGGSATMDVSVLNLQSEIALPFARPNPFHPGTHGTTGLLLTFESAPDPNRSVVIHDVRGRLVRTLTGADLTSNGRVALWDGRSFDGRPAVSGVYFFRWSGTGQGTGKVLLLR